MSVLVLMYIRVILFGVYEVLRSLLFLKNVKFEHVFWAIQLGVISEYLNHITGMRALLLLPNIVRILQNMRVYSRKSMIGMTRFILKASLQLMVIYSWQWIVVKLIVSIWDTHNDYKNQFVVPRIFNKDSTCFYPKIVIATLFVVDVCMLWVWPFMSGPPAKTCKVIRRIVWNYVRLESRVAENPRDHVILQIIS